MSKVKNLRDAEHFKELVARKDLTVFMFTAVWCGPCKEINDQIERLAVHHHPTVQFVKVDVDDHEEIAHKCNVQVLPTFMYVRDSAQVGHFIGADVAELKDELKLLTTPFEPDLMPK